MLNRSLPWYLVLATTAVLGLWHIGRIVSVRGPRLDVPDASVVELCRTHLGDANALGPLRAALAAVPEGQDLLLFGGKGDARAAEASLLISYVAWPRKVWFISQGLPLDSRVKHQPPPPGTKPGALLFYGMSPPQKLEGKTRLISSQLSLVFTGEETP